MFPLSRKRHLTGIVQDSFYLCSTSSTVGIIPFSQRYFDDLHADFEAAVEVTKHNDVSMVTICLLYG
jgi:hypothetical protein